MLSRLSLIPAAILSLALAGLPALADPAPAAGASTLTHEATMAVAGPGAAAASVLVKKLADGDIGGFYAEASEPFRRKFSPEKFKTIVEPLVKAGIRGFAWSNANVKTLAYGYSTDIGFYADRTIVKLKGEIGTAHAGLVDIELVLVKSAKGFQVDGINFKSRPGTVLKKAGTSA